MKPLEISIFNQDDLDLVSSFSRFYYDDSDVLGLEIEFPKDNSTCRFSNFLVYSDNFYYREIEIYKRKL
jgi:hypothetical protein